MHVADGLAPGSVHRRGLLAQKPLTCELSIFRGRHPSIAGAVPTHAGSPKPLIYKKIRQTSRKRICIDLFIELVN
jgi:hypothetical protein